MIERGIDRTIDGQARRDSTNHLLAPFFAPRKQRFLDPITSRSARSFFVRLHINA